MSETKQNEIQEITNSLGSSGISRKDFLKYTGATAGAAVATLGLASCEDDVNRVTPPGAVDLGSGDVGVLNYAYALEQLEAVFYQQVVGSFYSGATDEEKQVLTNVRDHEVAHFKFFQAVLTTNFPDAVIPGLTPTFEEAGVDFSSKASVLGTALAFENLGVSAYNGAASKLKNPDYLLAAGKIVSVEARHSAAISDIALTGNVGVAQDTIFETSIINEDGLGLAFPVTKVLGIADKYIDETIDASGIISQ